MKVKFIKSDSGKQCKCGIWHSNCSECGMSVMIGSSRAEHTLKHMGMNVFESDTYLPWEAPADECPNCYWKEHKRSDPKLTEKFNKILGAT